MSLPSVLRVQSTQSESCAIRRVTDNALLMWRTPAPPVTPPPMPPPITPTRPEKEWAMAPSGTSFTLSDNAHTLKECRQLLHVIDQPTSGSGSSQRSSSSLAKKKLSFADDHGLRLTSVRLISHNSDEPPILNKTVALRDLRPDEDVDESGLCDDHDQWLIDFAQPASDYVTFRKKLAAQHVCLENVVLRRSAADTTMRGTIRVDNVCFEKHVFVRYSLDNWATFQDQPAQYQSGNDLFDTFTFSVCLPRPASSEHHVIEFAVAFNQHWDSNSGTNYRLITSHLRTELERVKAIGHSHTFTGPIKLDPANASPVSDVHSHDYTNWSEFSAWKNLQNTEPYY